MMNKDEAVQKLATVGRLSIAHAEDLYDSLFEKPVVPQCVADWYEENKDDFEVNLFNCICEAVENYVGSSSNEFENWLMSKELEVITTLVNMHQFGYEVEEEPKYIVKLKNIEEIYSYLNYDTKEKSFKLSSETESIFFKTKFTKEFLEKNSFGWVFDCPGVEVKEVDE